MKQYSVLEFVQLVLKKWYIVLLVPVLLGITSVFAVNRYDQMNKTYTAKTTIVLASKYDVKKEKNTDQLRMIAQEYNKDMIGTVKELVKSTSVIKKTIVSVEGPDRYTSKQLNHQVVPKMQDSVRLVAPVNSTICWVVVQHDDKGKVKEFANQLVKVAAAEQKQIWGKSTIKVLSPAINPDLYDKHSTPKIALAVSLITFVLMSAVVVVRDNK